MQSEAQHARGAGRRETQHVGEVPIQGDENPLTRNGRGPDGLIVSSGQAELHDRHSIMAQSAQYSCVRW